MTYFVSGGMQNLNQSISLSHASLACIVVMNVLQGLSAIGVQQIDRVVEVVEETLKGIFYF